MNNPLLDQHSLAELCASTKNLHQEESAQSITVGQQKHGLCNQELCKSSCHLKENGYGNWRQVSRRTNLLVLEIAPPGVIHKAELAAERGQPLIRVI